MARWHRSIPQKRTRKHTWREQIDIYLSANGITDGTRKRDVLLTVCGPKKYHILRNLLAPKKPTEVSYGDIVQTLKLHFSPKQGVAVKRYKFNTRARQPGESISAYVAELRHLAIDCPGSEIKGIKQVATLATNSLI